MASVLVMILVRKQPPSNAEAIPRRQGTKDAELQIVTNISYISVLHSSDHHSHQHPIAIKAPPGRYVGSSVARRFG